MVAVFSFPSWRLLCPMPPPAKSLSDVSKTCPIPDQNRACPNSFLLSSPSSFSDSLPAAPRSLKSNDGQKSIRHNSNSFSKLEKQEHPVTVPSLASCENFPWKNFKPPLLSFAMPSFNRRRPLLCQGERTLREAAERCLVNPTATAKRLGFKKLDDGLYRSAVGW